MRADIRPPRHAVLQTGTMFAPALILQSRYLFALPTRLTFKSHNMSSKGQKYYAVAHGRDGPGAKAFAGRMLCTACSIYLHLL